MSCWTNQAWGICLDDYKLKEGLEFEKGIREILKGTLVGDEALAYLDKERENHRDETTDVEEILNDFSERLNNNGYIEVVACAISEKENEKFSGEVDSNGDTFLTVYPVLPFKENSNFTKSKDDFVKIFEKYMALLTNDKIVCKWQNIAYCS